MAGLVVFLDKFLEFSSLDQLLYLLLQILTFVSVMAMIIVKTKVLLWISLF